MNNTNPTACHLQWKYGYPLKMGTFPQQRREGDGYKAHAIIVGKGSGKKYGMKESARATTR